MKKILLFSFMLLSALVTESWAQERTISGKVTSVEDGSTLPGVNVVLKGTTNGTITDVDGNYKLSVPSEGGTLTFSFVGLASEEVEIGTRSVIDVSMTADVTQLSEIVVTGVGEATSRKKLSISVGEVGEEILQQVPAFDAASALRGKVAGVRVTSAGGTPGGAAELQLRGATSLTGTQTPLVLIDGVISENGLADIPADDIMKMEVVKGAAASSLYGSRAANGVVNITTKRGGNMKAGTIGVTFRTEYGQNFLPNKIPVNKSHPYIVPSGETYDIETHQTLTPTQISDNLYPTFFDYQDDVFNPGSFSTNYLSVAGKSESGYTNFSLSAQDFRQSGVIELSDGYKRQNVRLNIDNTSFNDRLNIRFSTFYSTSHNDLVSPSGLGGNPSGGDGSFLFDMLKLPPISDLYAPNEENDQPYNADVNPLSTDVNPLYDIYMRDITQDDKRIMMNAGATLNITDWLKVEGVYGLDQSFGRYRQYVPNTYIGGASTSSTRTGLLDYVNTERTSQTLRANIFGTKQFGDLDLSVRLSYLYESDEYNRNNFNGNNFNAQGVIDADALVQTDEYKFDIGSTFTETYGKNYFGVVAMTYKDRYIIDGLYRKDGISLFGENERWADFFRVSGAWRISEDVDIPQVQELKLRGSYGTAGNRPSIWAAQYETFSSGLFKSDIGNKNLRRELAKELEIGLNASAFNRLNLEVNYSITNLEDLIVRVPLAAPVSGGANSQYRNVGSMKNDVIELSLNGDVVKSKDLNVNVGVVFDRITNQVTKLDGINFLRMGPSPNDEAGKGMIYVVEGGVIGDIYGNQLMTSMDQLEEFDNPADWTTNSDGYLVLRSEIGTPDEKPYVDLDANGNAVYAKIGNTAPKFNMGVNTTVSWKGLSFYMLWDWKNGGDVYNQTKQWMYFESVHGDQDMSGVAENLKKPVSYFSNGLYNRNEPTDYFVEDASYVKLREMNLSYTVNNGMLSKIGIGNVVQSIKLSVVGRNLLVLSGYTGFDPEVSRQNPTTGASNSSTIYAYDGFTYPNLRSISGALTIKF